MLLCAAICTTLSRCHLPNGSEQAGTVLTAEIPSVPSETYSFDFAGNGKVKQASSLSEVYTPVALDQLPDPTISRELHQGLRKQLKVLKYRKHQHFRQFGEVEINTEKLIQSVENLLERSTDGDALLSADLAAYQLKGEDGKGNVFFTGYFTPVLKVSKTPTKTFRYPIYARPNSSKFPTRKQIDGEGVLKGLGLELAYVKDPLDIYFMQVQGSGIVEYPDGSRELFAHAGSNGHPYRSIGKHMIREGYTTPQGVSLKRIKKFFQQHPELIEEILYINKSYVFFTPKPYQATPKGAGHVNLTTNYSIAVDTKYIPLGSTLLAAVPIINRKNKVVRHEYRVLLAQDVGGAIKGTGHVDLYTGVGDEGRRRASALHHYGQLWLLLPQDANRLTASL